MRSTSCIRASRSGAWSSTSEALHQGLAQGPPGAPTAAREFLVDLDLDADEARRGKGLAHRLHDARVHAGVRIVVAHHEASILALDLLFPASRERGFAASSRVEEQA